MMRYLFMFFLLLILLIPSPAFTGQAEEEPLTLLHQPQKTGAAVQPPQAPAQPQQLRDIYGPVQLKDQPRIVLYATVIGLLLLAAAALFFILKRRKQSGIPQIPPWDRALFELTEAKTLLTADKPLSYMTRVSHILRNYIESRFAIKSTRQTTGEFLQDLSRSSADPLIKNCRDELQTCLEQCDMAKFAHHIPGHENMELVEDAIVSFVHKTRPDNAGSRGKT
ncbi:MAG: hypothetical protein JRC87_02695 [Deltaproteobacteria bacterium]|nr:hypothetical protein [Deltaproteobacteria bacterium]